MCRAFDLQVVAALDADGAKAVVEEAPARRTAAVERTFIVLIVCYKILHRVFYEQSSLAVGLVRGLVWCFVC